MISVGRRPPSPLNSSVRDFLMCRLFWANLAGLSVFLLSTHAAFSCEISSAPEASFHAALGLASEVKNALTHWKQPPVGCIEDLYPSLISADDCADLSNPMGKLKEGCALRKAVEEERNHPEMQLPMPRWLTLHLYIDREEKIELLYKAAEKYGMPPQFLYGVVNLEGLITDQGIISDGENYSCGTGSLNIMQYCKWASSLDETGRKNLGWPSGIPCDESVLPAAIVRSVFRSADLSNSSTRATPGREVWTIQMRPLEADLVSDETIQAGIRRVISEGREEGVKADPHQLAAIRSFTRTCSDPKQAIPAIAFSLKDIFDRLVPRALREQQRYSESETFEKLCKHPYSSKYFPLHAGWLFAYGIHNRGEDMADRYAHGRQRRALRRKSHYEPLTLISTLQNRGDGEAATNIKHVVKRMTIEDANLLPE